MKNRWLIAASAVGVHLSIGSIYAYSAWKMPLENTFGWSSANTSLAFSIAIFFLGLSAAFLGGFIQKQGPRKGSLLSAAFFCTGLVGSAAACWFENLYLFYLFFGAVSGVGLGLGYSAPIATLVKWFPDRRGLASGLAIMGFGFGGLVCASLIDTFVPKQSEIVLPFKVSAYDYQQLKTSNPDAAKQVITSAPGLPSYTRDLEKVEQMFRNQETNTREYQTLATIKTDFKKHPIYDKQSIVSAFLWLALIYALIMIPSALYITPPPDGYEDQFNLADKSTTSAENKNSNRNSIGREFTAKQAFHSRGFYGLWLMLFLNATCGIALIASAKKMGYEMVRLDIEMASYLVMGISIFNGLGRIFWATLSDAIGRSNTFTAFFAIQIIAFPLLANLTSIPWAFMLVTFIIITCYGGGFATMPAYISDLFGLKAMPTILGAILTAWAMAGVVGPTLNAYLYEKTQSYEKSLYLFGGLIVVGLFVSLAMTFESRRMRGHHNHHSNSEVEDHRKHNHGV